MKMTAMRMLVLLLGTFAVLGAVLAFVMEGCGIEIATARDAEEATHVVDALLKQHSFRVKSEHSARPAVYARPHRRFTEVLVYGNYSGSEMDEIVRATKLIRETVASRPIRLSFYPTELSKEGPLREVKVD